MQPEDLYKLDPNNKLVQNLNFITTVPNTQGEGDTFQIVKGYQTLDQKIAVHLPENIRTNVFKNPNPTEMSMEEFAAEL